MRRHDLQQPIWCGFDTQWKIGRILFLIQQAPGMDLGMRLQDVDNVLSWEHVIRFVGETQKHKD